MATTSSESSLEAAFTAPSFSSVEWLNRTLREGASADEPLEVRLSVLLTKLQLSAADVDADVHRRFSQLEPKRGIHATGGATIRFVERGGWGNAMYHLLTSDEFDAEEAKRIGLVQEIVPLGQQLERAIEIAEVIATGAPLAVQATKASSRRFVEEGFEAAVAALKPTQKALFETEDVDEGVQSFKERRAAQFKGR